MQKLRVGLLGASRVTPGSVVGPAKRLPEVELVSVAARDPERARRYAAKHGIAGSAAGYAELVASPDVDAVYIALPNSLHAEWTIKALEAGKHVLCEKPYAANAQQAQQSAAAAAAATGLTVMHGMHYRYHPLMEALEETVRGGELGEVEHVEAHLCFPNFRTDPVMAGYELGGGATMLCGVYPLDALRVLGPGEPEVVAARATLHSDQVDRTMEVDLRFPGGATGRVTCSISPVPRPRLSLTAGVVGERGSVKARNYLVPQLWNRLETRIDGAVSRRRVRGLATYDYQLKAFVDAVLHGGPVRTGPDDAVATMRLVDTVYEAAGLLPRGLSREATQQA
ncbi:Gfo/Idh/MocA family protein [Streptomyces sp. NPDC003032]